MDDTSEYRAKEAVIQKEFCMKYRLLFIRSTRRYSTLGSFNSIRYSARRTLHSKLFD